MLQDLMSEAMEETDSLQSHTLQSNGQELPLIYVTVYSVYSQWSFVGYWIFISLVLPFVGVQVDQTSDQDPPLSDLFLFPDESGAVGQDPCQAYPILHSPLISPPVPSTHHDSDDFCILDTPGYRATVRQFTLCLFCLVACTIIE